MGMEEYKLPSAPVSNPEACIKGRNYRITILTPALIRLEYSENGEFEDRATQSVLNRDFPVPSYYVEEKEEKLYIRTEQLEIYYDKNVFSTDGLRIKIRDWKEGAGYIWHFGEEPNDLKGTARTLDGCDGDRMINFEAFNEGRTSEEDCYWGKIKMEKGLLSRDGFSTIDDSHSMVLTANGFIEARKAGIQDLYFFGYGHRYLDCLRDFYHLCGKTPLLPRYAFGNWWSRYHRYTEEEYKELVTRFEEEKLPFSVAVVDMDWHIVDDVDPKYGSGWTGYTWNKKFFPDPKKFMSWLHHHNMKITLNVHPADGIRPFEDLYPRVAEKMGIDPASDTTVEFDPADPKFMEVYLKELHHPLEEEGVDFWWIDWQQGTKTKIPGLDPLWMLNHYHYLDSKWKGCRPMTFSRYAGVGSHRYPIGFSGDTVISWESLNFQPYFTNTASNIGYGWWSHDIGGHMFGNRDDELMARWVQFGVFSPINRLHSTDNPFNGKEPWKYDKITQSVMEEFLRLRHGMIPYLYCMNRRASREDLPLTLPLYYLEPEQQECYEVKNEYYFGSELLVSPITEKQDLTARAAKADTWIPKGLWADFFNGLVYRGGRRMNLYRGVEEIPVLMKAGAIVPMRDLCEKDNCIENPKRMEVRIFPAADGRFTLWEDAGDTPEDLDENWASTELIYDCEKSCFTIKKAKGNTDVLLEMRSWKLVFMAAAPSKVQVTADGAETEANVFYDKKLSAVVVEVEKTACEKEICVHFENGLTLEENHLSDRCYKILEKAQISYHVKQKVQWAVESDGKDSIAALERMELNEVLSGALSEILKA